MLSWVHLRNGLGLRHHGRVDRVPEPIEGLLLRGSPAPTMDVEADLLGLDAKLLRLHADLSATAGDQLQAIRLLRGRAGASLIVRNRRLALKTAVARHTRLVEQLDDVAVAGEVLREFVAGLDIREPPLADAVLGWQQDPGAPPFAEVFLDEITFAHLDPRRARRAGFGGLGGVEEWGVHWRREPDDEPSDLTPWRMSGTWAVGYLPSTTEVYAVRRAAGAPRTLWLLGGGFMSTEEVTSALATATPRMQAPNSLLIAVEALRRAAVDLAATARSELR